MEHSMRNSVMRWQLSIFSSNTWDNYEKIYVSSFDWIQRLRAGTEYPLLEHSITLHSETLQCVVDFPLLLFNCERYFLLALHFLYDSRSKWRCHAMWRSVERFGINESIVDICIFQFKYLIISSHDTHFVCSIIPHNLAPHPCVCDYAPPCENWISYEYDSNAAYWWPDIM